MSSVGAAKESSSANRATASSRYPVEHGCREVCDGCDGNRDGCDRNRNGCDKCEGNRNGRDRCDGNRNECDGCDHWKHNECVKLLGLEKCLLRPAADQQPIRSARKQPVECWISGFQRWGGTISKHFDSNAKSLVRHLLTADLSRRHACLKDGANDAEGRRCLSSNVWASFDERMRTVSLRLDEEIRSIMEKQSRSEVRRRLEFERTASEWSQLAEEVSARHMPDIVAAKVYGDQNVMEECDLKVNFEVTLLLESSERETSDLEAAVWRLQGSSDVEAQREACWPRQTKCHELKGKKCELRQALRDEEAELMTEVQATQAAKQDLETASAAAAPADTTSEQYLEVQKRGNIGADAPRAERIRFETAIKDRLEPGQLEKLEEAVARKHGHSLHGIARKSLINESPLASLLRWPRSPAATRAMGRMMLSRWTSKVDEVEPSKVDGAERMKADEAERVRRQPWRVQLQPWGGCETSLEDVVDPISAKLALRGAALWPAVAGGGAESEAANILGAWPCSDSNLLSECRSAAPREQLRCQQ